MTNTDTADVEDAVRQLATQRAIEDA